MSSVRSDRTPVRPSTCESSSSNIEEQQAPFKAGQAFFSKSNHLTHRHTRTHAKSCVRLQSKPTSKVSSDILWRLSVSQPTVYTGTPRADCFDDAGDDECGMCVGMSTPANRSNLRALMMGDMADLRLAMAKAIELM